MVFLKDAFFSGMWPWLITRKLKAASKRLHHHLMSRNLKDLLASGNTKDAINIPASVCTNMRPILKYRVIVLVVIVSVANGCKVIERCYTSHLF